MAKTKPQQPKTAEGVIQGQESEMAGQPGEAVQIGGDLPPVQTEAEPVDEHHGKGGSYVVGADGKRELMHRTAERDDQQAPAAGAEAPPAE